MIGTSRFQNGSLTLLKNKTSPGTWYFRFYEERDGRRVYRRQRIGSQRELPTRRDAEKAVLNFRVKINSGVRPPDTLTELINHYRKYELTEASGKRISTRDGYQFILDLYVEPRWGSVRLDQIRAVDVELWLRSLDFAPGTRAKIRNVMSAVFAHGVRHEFVVKNPIKGVRCSAQRQREPDVLTPDEFNRLVQQLPQRERVMVLVAGTTGLRRSELIALTWQDVDFRTLQLQVKRACVNGHIGETKTRASAKPVPLHRSVAAALEEWKAVTQFSKPTDFLFPSMRNNGEVPVWPDTLMRKVIRPAAKRGGIVGKVLGWHTFRHSLGTNLRFLGVDIKTAQELLRHANSRVTLDLYSQAVSAQKREASAKVAEMLLPCATTSQHHSEPAERLNEMVQSVNI
jgi:integrase